MKSVRKRRRGREGSERVGSLWLVKRRSRNFPTTCIGESLLSISFRQFPSLLCEEYKHENENLDETPHMQMTVRFNLHMYSSYTSDLN